MKYKIILTVTLTLTILLFFATIGLLIHYVPAQAAAIFGAPDPKLDFAQRLLYSGRLLFAQNNLLEEPKNGSQLIEFPIQKGESADQVAQRLKKSNLINDPGTFLLLLRYSGLDTRIRAGKYSIESPINALEIIRIICDLTPDHVQFVILPGMRTEEIAALLPGSGLEFDPDKFLDAVRNPQSEYLPELIKNEKNLEGFLFPGEYDFRREVSLDSFLRTILNRFSENITTGMISSWKNSQLSLEQGVILASIIQREMVKPDDATLISSVFHNRLKAGMKLESDATIQYVVGNKVNGWWKVGLSSLDFATQSSFNTYQMAGLPPSAICNPGLKALQASANPAATQYFFFQARCDGSGSHQFFATFAEHLANLCTQP